MLLTIIYVCECLAKYYLSLLKSLLSVIHNVCRYKPSPTGTVSDDPTPEYMNLLGMIFSMCGLMLKVCIVSMFC